MFFFGDFSIIEHSVSMESTSFIPSMFTTKCSDGAIVNCHRDNVIKAMIRIERGNEQFLLGTRIKSWICQNSSQKLRNSSHAFQIDLDSINFGAFRLISTTRTIADLVILYAGELIITTI